MKLVGWVRSPAFLLVLVLCLLVLDGARGLSSRATPTTTTKPAPTRSSADPSSWGVRWLEWKSSARHVLEHLLEASSSSSSLASTTTTKVEELANLRVPTGEPGVEVLAYCAVPSTPSEEEDPLPVLLLIHEFFGLNPSILEKARALADELGCLVVAPDTFRGASTTFVPKAIWLALTTPQERVNDDLDAVCGYLSAGSPSLPGGGDVSVDPEKLAVMGFCYGGGKALRYAVERKPQAAAVVFYGSPVTDAGLLGKLKAPVCGIFGSEDVQFPKSLLDRFEEALEEAGVEHQVRVYDGVGHAFWKNMDQVERGEEPQLSAYKQCTGFLRSFFFDEE